MARLLVMRGMYRYQKRRVEPLRIGLVRVVQLDMVLAGDAVMRVGDVMRPEVPMYDLRLTAVLALPRVDVLRRQKGQTQHADDSQA